MPKVEERVHSCIESLLRRLRVGEPQVRDGLWLFPLLADPTDAPGPDVATLQEAMDRRWIAVTEVNESGVVGQLAVNNQAPRPVLLLDGEELVGARQNRILNTSVAAAPQARTVVPVSCVEQQRWSYQDSQSFGCDGRLYPVSLRSRKLRHVTHNLRTQKSYQSCQQEVWQDVTQLNQRLGTQSATQAMSDGLKAHTTRLQTQWRGRAMPHQVGNLALLGQVVLGMDVLGTPELYAQLHRRLLDSYAIETVGRRPPEATEPRVRQRAHAFLRGLWMRRLEAHPAVGQGLDVRFETISSLGSALVLGDSVLHLAAFPK